MLSLGGMDVSAAAREPVYCFGHVTTGQILRIADPYPAPNGYAEVVQRAENYCGEATGTALVLRRLGVPTQLAGNWLGDDGGGRRTLAYLRGAGIDVSALRIEPGYPGATEVVITDPESRTVFGRFVDLLTTTPQWDPPDAARIAASRLVCVDPDFGDASLAAVSQAQAAGVPFVTSDAFPESPLVAAAEAVVISADWLGKRFGLAEMEAQFDRYCRTCPGLVVFTQGAGPVWWGRGEVRAEQASFSVPVVDTAGAGDSFRAGVIYGLLQGWEDARTVRFATAVAALVCASFPGVLNGPDLPAVEAFLGERT